MRGQLLSLLLCAAALVGAAPGPVLPPTGAHRNDIPRRDEQRPFEFDHAGGTESAPANSVDYSHPPPPSHHDERTVYQIVSDIPGFTKFTKAIDFVEDMVAYLNHSTSDLTFFVVPDYEPHHDTELIGEEDDSRRHAVQTSIRSLLEYHTVPERLHIHDGPASASYPTKLALSGSSEGVQQRLKVERHRHRATVNGRSVIRRPIRASNGFIYVLDLPLSVPDSVQQGLMDSSASWMLSAMKHADMLETLSSENSMTLFAPDNRAFEHLPKNLREYLFSEEGSQALRKLLQYHVVPDVIFYSDYVHGLPEDAIVRQTPVEEEESNESIVEVVESDSGASEAEDASDVEEIDVEEIHISIDIVELDDDADSPDTERRPHHIHRGPTWYPDSERSDDGRPRHSEHSHREDHRREDHHREDHHREYHGQGERGQREHANPRRGDRSPRDRRMPLSRAYAMDEFEERHHQEDDMPHQRQVEDVPHQRQEEDMPRHRQEDVPRHRWQEDDMPPRPPFSREWHRHGSPEHRHGEHRPQADWHEDERMARPFRDDGPRPPFRGDGPPPFREHGPPPPPPFRGDQPPFRGDHTRPPRQPLDFEEYPHMHAPLADEDAPPRYTSHGEHPPPIVGQDRHFRGDPPPPPPHHGRTPPPHSRENHPSPPSSEHGRDWHPRPPFRGERPPPPFHKERPPPPPFHGERPPPPPIHGGGPPPHWDHDEHPHPPPFHGRHPPPHAPPSEGDYMPLPPPKGPRPPPSDNSSAPSSHGPRPPPSDGPPPSHGPYPKFPQPSPESLLSTLNVTLPTVAGVPLHALVDEYRISRSVHSAPRRPGPVRHRAPTQDRQLVQEHSELSHTFTRLSVDGVHVIATDIVTANGPMHVLSSVLCPRWHVVQDPLQSGREDPWADWKDWLPQWVGEAA
ncbi:hypothetical protein BD626DRAFT_633300 [Schizophyllum amplum]|uniref:FAS1 domain-containing protein n=1 Tax=Schizophyllum amplum TaxID=97359 RepID=A0A550C3X1_9AGAR|nr:hypothetical protein BD626DRAFT_633300 [Auriculariopsis ampla]